MALTLLTSWNVGDILTAADLNAEFLNIYSLGENLSTPATKTHLMAGNTLGLDADGNSSISAAADDIVDIAVASIVGLRIDGNVGSAKNGIAVVASITNENPMIGTTGADADLGITFVNDPTQGEEILILDAVPSAVNEITITNAAAGNTPIIGLGTTSEVDVGITFNARDAEPMLLLGAATAATNWINISSAATTANPTIACEGESDIGITLQNQDAEPMLVLDSVATSTNWVTIASAAAGADATIIGGAAGADAGLTLQGKGTGTVKFGDAAVAFPDTDGSNGDVLVTDGAGLMSFVSPTYVSGNLPLPRNYLGGLQTTRTSSTLIDVAIGECRAGSSADQNLANFANTTAAFGKTFATGGWVAGDGNRGVPTAAGFAASVATWHYFALVGTDGSIEFGYDTSLTAANLVADAAVQAELTATVYYRRIFSFRSSATPDIPDYTQVGNDVILDTRINENPTPPSDTTANTVTLAGIPTGINVKAWFNLSFDDSSKVYLSVYSLNGTSSTPTTTNGSMSLGNDGTSFFAQQFWVMTNTSAQIGLRASEAITTLDIGTLGWIDTRGRDD